MDMTVFRRQLRETVALQSPSKEPYPANSLNYFLFFFSELSDVKTTPATGRRRSVFAWVSTHIPYLV